MNLNIVMKFFDKVKGMCFRGIYFTTGGVDELTKPVIWQWGWRHAQSQSALFLGFCYLSWTI